jgi:hypothetical protein
MSPREYREFAAQCLRWAVRTKSDEHKSAMLKMAHHWTQTAERLERAAEPYWAAATRQPEDANSGEK